MKKNWFLIFILLVFSFSTSFSHPAHDGMPNEQSLEETPDSKQLPKVFKRQQSIRLNNKIIKYQVIAEEIYLKDEKQEKEIASIFSTSYFQLKTDKKRPVLFIFNGGPGSASLWLHMGVLGPKHVSISDTPSDDGAPPYQVISNPYSLIDIADLVFIDPVGSGWSHTLGKASSKQFWGVEEDVHSIYEFIRRWLTKHKRWNAPIYLVGESYGTTRAAALVNKLETGWSDIPINGIILVSSILNFQLDSTDPGNDVGYIGLFPSYAATSWYHKKIDSSKWNHDFKSFLEEVRHFALEEYLPSLFYGQTLSEDKHQNLVQKLALYTGLSESFIDRANLRIRLGQFQRELLRDQNLSVGRFDSRFTGKEPDGVGEWPEGDPSGYGVDSAFTASIMDYFINDLGIEIERPYKTIGNVYPWNWQTNEAGGMNSYLNVAPWLERAMRQNKDLKVMVANGYYDLATPFFATEITFSQPGFDRNRVFMHYYDAGHMMYIYHPAIEKLTKDMRQFILQK